MAQTAQIKAAQMLGLATGFSSMKETPVYRLRCTIGAQLNNGNGMGLKAFDHNIELRYTEQEDRLAVSVE